MRKKVIPVIFLILVIVVLILLLILKNTILKRFYVIKYSEYVEKYSEEYDIDKYLVYSIIKAESNFNERAQSNKGAQGLMQLMYSTAEEIAKKIDMEIDEQIVLEPDSNINLGTYYIAMLIQKYNSIELALTAYNAGSGNVDSWIENGILKDDGSNIENIPYKETNIYVRKILQSYNIYKDLYGERS